MSWWWVKNFRQKIISLRLFEGVKMKQKHQQFLSSGSQNLVQGWGRVKKKVAKCRLLHKFYLYLKWWQILKYWELVIWFLNIVNNPLTFTLKVLIYYPTHIRSLTSLERSELGVSIFLKISMLGVKKTDIKIGQQKISL